MGQPSKPLASASLSNGACDKRFGRMTSRSARLIIELSAVSIACLTAGCATRRSNPLDQAPARLDAIIHPLLLRYDIPDVAIAVSDRGRILIDTIFTADGSVISSDHRFEAASLSKPVFAASVMLLAKAGRINLDTPVVKYLDWTPVQDSRIRAVTARMLLSHSSGIDGAVFASAPGTQWKYSGAGYTYLQRALEQIVGESFDAFATAAILQPLGMTHSTLVDPSGPDTLDLPGYDRRGMNPVSHRFTRASAASSLRTTAGDYLRFVTAVVNSAAGDSSIFPATSTRAMLQPQIRVDSVLGLSWGLGWALAPPVFFHWGSNPGYKSFALGDPTTGLAVVILTNADNGLEIAEPIVAAIIGRRLPLFRFYMLHPTD
jgi:CubicO group peptidase (beta-lactamase class C family)